MADNYRNMYGAGPVAGTLDQATIDVGLRKHMLSVYNYMASGLVLSGIVALAVFGTSFGDIFYQRLGSRIVGINVLGWVAIFAPLGLLLLASFNIRRMSAATMQGFYWSFVALQGVGLALLLSVYTGESVVRVFFITAASFAGLSLYGYTTKRSLSAIGSFLIMGLFGLIIASVVNMFVASSGMAFVISIAGVLIFAGLIAYDTQRIKEQYVASWDSGTQSKAAVWSALSLYLDFINLLDRKSVV